MAYKTLTQYNSPNYTPYNQVASVFGKPRAILSITGHWWGDPNTGPTFEGVVAWLCNPRSQVSAHEVVTGTDKRSATLLDYNDAAWHSGNPAGNATSIAVEADPRCRDEDYDAFAEVVADIRLAYGKNIPLVPHNLWSSTRCPGGYDLDRVNREAEAWYKRKTQPAQPTPVPTPQPQPEPAKPEWVVNLEDITDIKLTVLPADGVQVINLNTLQPINDTLIPRGTNIDIAKATNVQGKKYYISSYAVTKGAPNGILAESLGTLEQPKPQEKPEWLKYLNDIQDVVMYARSETPVLLLENGSVTRKLQINDSVKITHATEVLGVKLLVLDGGKECIEPVYLSDTAISQPYEDLKKRVSLLEEFMKIIKDLLAKIGIKI